MTKTKFWLSILAISVVLVAGSLAVSPIAIADDDDEQPTQGVACPAENVQHWTAVIFQPNSILNHPTFGQLFTQLSDYKFITNPTEEPKDLREEIADSLNEDGWQKAGNNPVQGSDIGSVIAINAYSICAEN